MEKGDKVKEKEKVKEEELLEKYMSQLDDLQKQACSIAKEHLETSFDIVKSNGYKQWLQGKNSLP